jgi:colicin import membrane protein
MKYALNIGKEPNFQTIVITSAVIHLILITLIVIPLRSNENEYRSYFVDLVGPLETPRKNTAARPSPAGVKEKEEKNEVRTKEPAAKPLPKADMSLESEARIKKEIERIRSISALSKLKSKKEEKKAQDIEAIRHNVQVSTVRSGASTGAQSLAHDSYYALITRKIWGEWIYPDFGSSGLEVIISLKIEKDGRIVSHEIEKPSGNALFDRSAMNAVSKASPLPPPPVEMEIGLRFYL